MSIVLGVKTASCESGITIQPNNYQAWTKIFIMTHTVKPNIQKSQISGGNFEANLVYIVSSRTVRTT